MAGMSTTADYDLETTEEEPTASFSEMTLEIMTFDSARNLLLSAIGEPVAGPSRRTTGTGAGRVRRQRRTTGTGTPDTATAAKLNWKAIINAYLLEAGRNGLSMADIQAVWKVVENRNETVQLGVQGRANLVLSMVPQREKISLKLVEDMLGWLIRSTAEAGHFDKPQTKMLIYLIGLIEYGLIDGNPITLAYYFKLCSLTRMSQILPLLCTLLNLVTTPASINKAFVNDLIELRSKGLPRDSMTAVNSLLGTYKSMCPRLIPRKAVMSRMIGSHISVEIDPIFQKKLYDAQGRVAGRETTSGFVPAKRTSMSKQSNRKGSAAMDLIFPEFKPSMDVGRITCFPERATVKDQMFYCLVKDECFLNVGHNPEMFHQFIHWTSLVFRHKFQNYDGKEAHRYKFILDRCNSLSNIFSVSLSSVDDWLPDYMMTWDFTLFRQEIFQMIPRLSLLDFEDGYMCLLEAFERRFIDGNLDERLEVWETMEKLYNHWCNLVVTDGPLPPPINNERSRSEIVNTLFDFMSRLVTNYTASVGKGEIVLLFTMCRTYLELMINYKAHPGLCIPIPPMALWYQVVFSDSFIMINTFCYLAKLVAKIAGRNHLLYIEFCKFFQPFGSGLGYIFSAELKYLEDRRQKEGGNSAATTATVEGQDSDLVPLDELEKKLEDVVDLNCYNWKGLRPFRCKVPLPDDSGDGLTKVVFKFVSKDQAPFLIRMLKTHGAEVEILGED